jgi:immune inhibitor A
VRRSARRALGAFALGSITLATAAVGAVGAGAAPPPEQSSRAAVHGPDNRPGPLSARQDARRKAALAKVRSGEAEPDQDGVVELAEGKAVEVAALDTDQVFTILAEFGDTGSGRLGTTPGPLHNQITPPDRTVDNTTLYEDDFSRAYYEDLFFGTGESFADFYLKQSSGQFTVAGAVSDWVQVPGNASSYGDNVVEDLGGAWQFVEDSGDAWYAAQIAAGMSPAQIDAYLAQFDVWDRYDFDEDGNFDEPDGYLDHFQAIHAGEGEEGNGGEDAIWSHRWYVNPTDFGTTGPVVGADQVKFGGAQIGDSKYWIGDYTTEPENGGLGVFTHEFGHDLGLPDLYDTAGGDNGTGFWTLMSAGSWMNHGGDDIGSTPDHMGPWEKLQLGWLDYATVAQGSGGSYTLNPAAEQIDGSEQALLVDVPDESVTSDYNTPYSGSYEWWSGSADDLNSTLTRTVSLAGISRATLTAKAWYDIEEGYDYLYAEYSTDGETWTLLGDPITGSTNGKWTTLRLTVPGGNANTQIRFRYQSDGGVHLAGAFLDDITIKNGGTQLFFDDVEGGDNGWVADGFTRMGGSATVEGDRYYLAEYRAYSGYDATLAEGPYNFSRAYTAPNWADRFRYQDGMLVWAVDETYTDNNTSEHPGHGLVLPIDAHPATIFYSDGARLGNRRQPFDATFGLQQTDDVTFRREILTGKGKAKAVTFATAVPVSRTPVGTFSDAVTDAYWASDNPWSSALVAGHGATIAVNSQTAGGMTVTVTNPPAPTP